LCEFGRALLASCCAKQEGRAIRHSASLRSPSCFAKANLSTAKAVKISWLKKGDYSLWSYAYYPSRNCLGKKQGTFWVDFFEIEVREMSSARIENLMALN